MKFMVVISLVLACGPLLSKAEAQAPGGSSAKSRASRGPQKQVATIVISGLAGAMLGMSTLSFYGRPQDNMANIAIGFALGVIIGTTYTTYQATTKTREFYRGGGSESEAWRQLAAIAPPAEGSRWFSLGIHF